MEYKKTGEDLYRFTLKTDAHTQMTDITGSVQDIISASGITDGLCVVYVPHTTAAVTVNENADPDVQKDIMTELGKVIPWEDGYRHCEGNAAAHLKASLMGFSETLIVHEGRLLLGTWQAVYFLEYDGPRTRSVYVKLMRR
mgnify:CR=1 FL=1